MKKNEFEKLIKYVFQNPDLLIEALTHSSSMSSLGKKKKKSYERLEFLGDRVLGLVLAEYFFKLFPDANEGLLNDYFQKYVNQDFLYKFAKRIKISNFIIIQKGDNLDNNKSVLSDVIESLIGAIYLDSNLDEAKNFIENELLKEFSIKTFPNKHSKSLLQEYSLSNFKKLPEYLLIEKKGPDHMPDFEVSVKLDNNISMIGKGKSLKIAEETAASKLLVLLNN